MRSFFTFVAIVACAISCGFSICVANDEPLAAERPSGESSPEKTVSEESSSATARTAKQPEVLCPSPDGAIRIERNGEKVWVILKILLSALSYRRWKAFRLLMTSFTLRPTTSGSLAREKWRTAFQTAIYFIGSIRNTSRLRRQRKINRSTIWSGHIV
jgi:hypothetical protein